MKSFHVLLSASALLAVSQLSGCKKKETIDLPIRPLITTDSMDDKADGRPPEAFPELSKDVFAGMDGGVALTEDEIKGRNSWNLWCGGDEQFWDKMAREGFGLFDLLKTIDSRLRAERLDKFGLINQPDFKRASKPDKHGLWIDEGAEPEGIDPKVFGRPTGLFGFRLFDNPDFKGAAAEEWKKYLDPVTGEAKKFYEDADFAARKDLVRPYRVGVSCGSCHIAFHPCFPPEDRNEPKYENLASAIGNQYIKEGATFAPNVREGGFFHEMIKAQPRGTSDTSRIATDNINNPNTINAIFLLAERERIRVEEDIDGGSLALPFIKEPQKVAHILKDGADSIDVPGATIRVFVNIGMHHQQWLQRHNAMIGLMKQEPFDIKTARERSTYWVATEQKVANIAKFFRKLEPYRLEDAKEKGVEVGKTFMTQDPEVVKRGALVFGENCATCHSSKQPAEGEDPEKFFASQLSDPAAFRKDNFFSDEKRYPITKIKTNAGRAVATNAMAGHIWDNFSSKTYKDLASVGTIQVWNPYTEQNEDFAVEGGGPGFYRTPSLISIWSSAPFLHNNALGDQPDQPDPSVAGRMKLFDDAVQKLLWPEKRKGKDSIWRTSRDCQLQLQASRLPENVVKILRAKGALDKDPDGTEFFRIGHIPKRTPINLLANLNPKAGHEALAEVMFQVKRTLAEIKIKRLEGDAAKEEMKKQIAPALFKASKCPDFVNDRGHTFGSELADADKLDLIEYLKTL